MKNYFGFIYKWTDESNGKSYTGSHMGAINDGYIGSGTLFKRAYEKRPEAFTKEILEYVYEDDRNILLEIEQKYLDLIDWDNTYNVSQSATAGPGRIPGYTRILSEKHKLNIGKANRGNIPWSKGKIFSNQHKQNMSNASKGIPKSEEHRQNMRKPLSAEHKRKISEAHKGKSLTKEHKRNISEANKGRLPTVGMTGKSHSEETKRKISIGKKGWSK